jgi:hypothetical protein
LSGGLLFSYAKRSCKIQIAEDVRQQAVDYNVQNPSANIFSPYHAVLCAYRWPPLMRLIRQWLHALFIVFVNRRHKHAPLW